MRLRWNAARMEDMLNNGPKEITRMEEIKKNKKYAGQVVDISRSQKRISFTDRLQMVSEEEGDPYLNVFSKKSIYLVSLFLFEENRSLIANLPIEDIPSIKKRSEYAGAEIFHLKHFIQPTASAEEDPAAEINSVPAAFTKLKMGSFAGKTPGDLLLEAADAEKVKASLLQQASFLGRNLKKYPQNQSQIDAINDAINAYDIGILEEMKPGHSVNNEGKTKEIRPAFTKLKMGSFAGKTPGDLLLEAADAEKVKASLLQQADFLREKLETYPQNQSQIDAIEDAIHAYDDGNLAACKPKEEIMSEETPEVTYEIYRTPVKHQKKLNEAGKNECYSIYISCSPTRRYPYRIEIMNCYAPLMKMKGLTPPDMSRADSLRKEFFDLTEEEWDYILEWITSNTDLTRTLWYPELRRKDEANRWKGNNR